VGAGRTGPAEGQATGQRDPGTPEDVTFRREKVPSRGLAPSGRPVGVLTVPGESLPGEVTIEKSAEVREAARALSEEVEKEPLPIEHREQVRRFYDLLLEGGGAEKER
jgi:hypothetical protein